MLLLMYFGWCLSMGVIECSILWMVWWNFGLYGLWVSMVLNMGCMVGVSGWKLVVVGVVMWEFFGVGDGGVGDCVV